jgi:hypothetical protein
MSSLVLLLVLSCVGACFARASDSFSSGNMQRLDLSQMFRSFATSTYSARPTYIPPNYSYQLIGSQINWQLLDAWGAHQIVLRLPKI